MNNGRFDHIFQCYFEKGLHYLWFEFAKYFILLVLSESVQVCTVGLFFEYFAEL